METTIEDINRWSKMSLEELNIECAKRDVIEKAKRKKAKRAKRKDTQNAVAGLVVVGVVVAGAVAINPLGLAMAWFFTGPTKRR